MRPIDVTEMLTLLTLMVDILDAVERKTPDALAPSLWKMRDRAKAFAREAHARMAPP